jgi:hypothetical protein
MSRTNNTEEAAQVPRRGDDANVVQQLVQEGAGASISQATPPDQEVYLQFNLPCIVVTTFRMLCPCLRSFVVVQLFFLLVVACHSLIIPLSYVAFAI